VELKLSVILRLLVYTDDVNLQGYKINIMKKDTEVLFDTSKEVSPRKCRDN
jgi:hypothetical protein